MQQGTIKGGHNSKGLFPAVARTDFWPSLKKLELKLKGAGAHQPLLCENLGESMAGLFRAREKSCNQPDAQLLL